MLHGTTFNFQINCKRIKLDLENKYEKRKNGKLVFIIIWEPKLKHLMLWHYPAQLLVTLQDGYKVCKLENVDLCCLN